MTYEVRLSEISDDYGLMGVRDIEIEADSIVQAVASAASAALVMDSRKRTYLVDEIYGDDGYYSVEDGIVFKEDDGWDDRTKDRPWDYARD